jgi:hypothetical protein
MRLFYFFRNFAIKDGELTLLPYNKYAVGTPFCRLQESH